MVILAAQTVLAYSGNGNDPRSSNQSPWRTGSDGLQPRTKELTAASLKSPNRHSRSRSRSQSLSLYSRSRPNSCSRTPTRANSRSIADSRPHSWARSISPSRSWHARLTARSRSRSATRADAPEPATEKARFFNSRSPLLTPSATDLDELAVAPRHQLSGSVKPSRAEPRFGKGRAEPPLTTPSARSPQTSSPSISHQASSSTRPQPPQASTSRRNGTRRAAAPVSYAGAYLSQFSPLLTTLFRNGLTRPTSLQYVDTLFSVLLLTLRHAQIPQLHFLDTL